MLCNELVGCLKTPDLVLSELGSGDTLLEFCKCALRLGVGGETVLLEVLAATLQASPPCPQHQQAWDMLLSHSQFLPSLLGNKHHNKSELVSSFEPANWLERLLNIKNDNDAFFF